VSISGASAPGLNVKRLYPSGLSVMGLSVNLTPVANLHHKDAQSAGLNVTNHPAIAQAVAPESAVRLGHALPV
jgi:hypothetical protein